MLTPVINDYRKGLKPKVIAVAAEMFRDKGIRAVKMDDIAHRLSISKRTLYEMYPNKEEMVMECIMTESLEREKAFIEMIPTDASTMDVLILFFRYHLTVVAGMNPTLYDELMNYPRMKEFMEDHLAKHSESAIKFFRRGVEEGYFLPDCDMEVAHRMNTMLSEQIRIQHLHNEFPSDRIFKVLIQLFIRGFCTIKGIEMLDKAMSEMK